MGGKVFDEQSARRISRTVQEVERQTRRRTSRSFPGQLQPFGIVGKIVGEDADGFYEVDEQEWDDVGAAWQDKVNGQRIWDGVSNLPLAYEINGLTGIPIGTFVFIVPTANDVNTTLWAFHHTPPSECKNCADLDCSEDCGDPLTATIAGLVSVCCSWANGGHSITENANCSYLGSAISPDNSDLSISLVCTGRDWKMIVIIQNTTDEDPGCDSSTQEWIGYRQTACDGCPFGVYVCDHIQGTLCTVDPLTVTVS